MHQRPLRHQPTPERTERPQPGKHGYDTHGTHEPYECVAAHKLRVALAFQTRAAHHLWPCEAEETARHERKTTQTHKDSGQQWHALRVACPRASCKADEQDRVSCSPPAENLLRGVGRDRLPVAATLRQVFKFWGSGKT
jgi:hypothetical protein